MPATQNFLCSLRTQELSVTDVNGEKIRTNFRVAPEDKELLDTLGAMLKR